MKENKEDLKEHNIDKMSDNNRWKQAKDMFITIVLLLDYEPDTNNGDNLLLEVFTGAELDGIVDQNDFDLYMWSDMC